MFFLLSMYLLLFSLNNFLFSIMFLMKKINLMMYINMINFLSFNINFMIYIDWMSLIFTSIVMMISSMVLIYSIEYMNNHIFLKRFMILIIIFFISMMLMIMSPNFISILLGWDGLGLSSFCLIIFYQNKKSYNSGVITMMMNRIGDINILMIISMMIYNNNSFNMMFLKNIPLIILIFIFFASITKSAQIPFSTWLPLAMAAPTPVSSLVHSSTLVTAGVYLMIRLNYILSNKLMYMILLVSFWTMLLSSTSALIEYDLKKIIALSTLSQLSLMFMTISLNFHMLSFFHLMTHAMFKSLLFLCSGIMIHNYYNIQDIRMISMLSLNMPLVSMIFNIASLTLCGMPFLSGFYSKDLIIESFSMMNINTLIFNMMYLSMMLTILYSLRLIYYISLKYPSFKNFNKSYISNKMIYSIYLLFFMSLFFGSSINWLMFNSMNLIILDFKSMTLIYKLSLLSTLIIFFLKLKMNLKSNFILLIYFFNKMWFLPKMFKKSKIILNLNMNLLNKHIDSGWLEHLSFMQILNFLINLLKYKKIYKLKFSIIMSLSSYLLCIMIFM
nr:NADH dehydrogenase subunit 5 [Meteorus sp. 2 XHS-2023a]